MKTYVNKGENVTFTTPGAGVTSGIAVLIGSLVVIATTTEVVGGTFVGLARGVVIVAKVSAQAWTEGVKIYWDDAAKLFTTTSAGGILVGVATKAAANPSATGYVRLDGVAR